MKITLTKKYWQANRPNTAKGSGVAKAIDALKPHINADTGAKSEKDIKEASAALDMLAKCLDAAEKKLKTEKKKHANFVSELAIWHKEIQVARGALADRSYMLRVASVQATFDESYAQVAEKFTTSWDACQKAEKAYQRDNQTLPSSAQLQIWMGSIRDMARFLSKQGLANFQKDYDNAIKLSDIKLPSDIARKKSDLKDMTGQCEIFAELIKNGTQNAGASLGDTKAVDRQVKVLTNAYKEIVAKNKKMEASAKRMARQVKEVAENIKAFAQGGQGRAENLSTSAKNIVSDIKAIAADIEKLRNENVALHKTYRENDQPLARMGAAIRNMDGYDEGTHGKIMVDTQSNCQVAIRLVTLPLGEAERQLKRCQAAAKKVLAAGMHRV